MQTAVNRHTVAYRPVYATDFEGATDVLLAPPEVSVTTAPGEVVAGSRSLKLQGAAAFAIMRPDALGLRRDGTYLLELEYRLLQTGHVGVVLQSHTAAGPEYSMVGVLPGGSASGRASWSFRAPGDSPTLILYGYGAVVAVDNIRILSETRQVTRAALPLPTAAFPRLADYMLLGPAAIAGMHGLDETEAERVTARYDMLLGPGFDHTQGASAWVRRLRALNPALVVLPYRQAFMAQFDGSAGLNERFNAGLHADWFMRSPSGALLAEPAFPQNVQLNHTLYAPSIAGQTLAGYSTTFLARDVLTSGLWDGLVFDQAEWYRNPLLGTQLIDLDRDGSAEPLDAVNSAWAAGFASYFRAAARQLGFTQLLVGNAGYLANNPGAIGALNGWIAERAEPYAPTAAGEWDTDAGSGWYRLLGSYLQAGRSARAPQVPVLEFTGRGLGQGTGGWTPNGEPARALALESRDFRRMRLGLTTALLGNGFFEYDLVDNTTPSLWFDEYAVGANGHATDGPDGKGYLGEPLGDAQELPYAGRTLFRLDFEGTSPPSGVYAGPGRLSGAASEVISGRASLVVEKHAADTFSWFVWASGLLQPGRSYQLIADYRILSVSPHTHAGLFALGFMGADGSMPAERTAGLFMPDGGEPGRTGTVRASLKATGSGTSVLGLLTDVGAVALDDIRLIEGTGGVWRRDFEHGIVLVNPTPEPIVVTQSQVAGPRGRTGVRRISGTQAPAWNTGAPVTAGITIPPGDGIVLLADAIPRNALSRPTAVNAAISGSTATLTWAAGTAYAAGYQVEYGEHPAHLTRLAAAGPSPELALGDLVSGATYYARISPYDFRGRIGPASDVVTFTMPGTPRDRPVFAIASPGRLVPGGTATLAGSRLSDGTSQGTLVEVNGLPAAITSLSSAHVSFVVPAGIAGTDAVLNVIRNGVPGVEQIVPVVSD